MKKEEIRDQIETLRVEQHKLEDATDSIRLLEFQIQNAYDELHWVWRDQPEICAQYEKDRQELLEISSSFQRMVESETNRIQHRIKVLVENN